MVRMRQIKIKDKWFKLCIDCPYTQQVLDINKVLHELGGDNIDKRETLVTFLQDGNSDFYSIIISSVGTPPRFISFMTTSRHINPNMFSYLDVECAKCGKPRVFGFEIYLMHLIPPTLLVTKEGLTPLVDLRDLFKLPNVKMHFAFNDKYKTNIEYAKQYCDKWIKEVTHHEP